MTEIKYQLIDEAGGILPTIYTAKVKPGETFDATAEVALRRCQDMVIELGERRMQPRRIRRCTNGTYLLSYGFPRGKSWSQGAFVTEINVTEIN